MCIAHSEEPASTIFHRRSDHTKTSPIGTPEELEPENSTSFTSRHTRNNSATATDAHSPPTSGTIQDEANTVSAVHYKPPVDRTTQQERHATVHDEDTERLSHNWQNEIGISEKYGEYRTKCVDMLWQLQHM